MHEFLLHRFLGFVLAFSLLLTFWGCGDGVTESIDIIEIVEKSSDSHDSDIELLYSSSSKSSKVVCVTIKGKVSECDRNLPMYRKNSSASKETSSATVTSSSTSFGTNKFIDTRDDNSYDTVHVGSQVWLAENLNYQFRGSYFLDSYDGVPAFGYYSPADAQVACPSGSHLPSEYEWSVLLNLYSKPSYEGYNIYFSLVGNLLKSKEGWLGRDVGENDIGFNAYPTGYVFNDEFMEFGYRAEFWTSTAAGEDSVRVVRIVANDHYAVIANETNEVFLPVRCVIGDTLVPLSSSSVYVPSSSSDAEVKPSGTYNCSYNECVTEQNLDPTKTYMDVLDDRENKVYKAIKVDTLYWLAQNLDYAQSGSTCASVAENEESNCEAYGRLYTWNQAENACMAGWRIPTRAEFEDLFKNTSENDDLGLAILPTGYIDKTGLTGASSSGYYWTSTEYVSYATTYEYAAQYRVSTGWNTVWATSRDHYLAVRCVRKVGEDASP